MHIPSHPVHTTAYCNPLQPAANHPVHIQCTLQQSLHLQCTLQPCTAMYSYLQPTFSAHCSQLQPSTTIYTTAILSSAHCSYTIQCTLQLHHAVHITSSAPLDHHRVSLYHYWPTSRAVSKN